MAHGVHVRVCACSHVCGVCVCAVLHRTVLVCTVLCNTGACARGVCGACIARVMRARGASARVRGLAIPVAGNVCAALSPRSLGSARPMLLQFVEDVEEDVEGFI